MIDQSGSSNTTIPEPLNSGKIEQFTSTYYVKKIDEIIIFRTITSTNDYLLEHVKTSQQRIIACFAEYQTAGRGQHGRSWVSPFADGLCFSLLYHFSKPIRDIMGLSLSTAVAIVQGLVQYGVTIPLQLKWPNDIFCQDSKLSGILIEGVPTSEKSCSVVIGVGINNISNIIQQPQDRNRLAGIVLSQLLSMLDIFEQKGLPPFIPQWEQHDMLHGQAILICDPHGNTEPKNSHPHIVEGIMQGITQNGALLLQTADGHIEQFMHGQVSVRHAHKK